MRAKGASAFEKNISRPSGEKSHKFSVAGWCVTRKGTPPVTGNVYRSVLPS
jgi:hypothetical protein